MMKISTSLVKIRYAVGVMLALSAVFAVVIGTDTTNPNGNLTQAQTTNTVGFSAATISAVTEGSAPSVTVQVDTAPGTGNKFVIPVEIAVANENNSASTYDVSMAASVEIADTATSNTLSITTVQDELIEGAETLVLKIGSLAGTGLTLDERTTVVNYPSIQIPITDDDTPAATATTLDPATIVEGKSGTYTIKLDKQPNADVYVAIAQSGTANPDITLSSSRLTFTPENYATAQTVTVSVAEDDDAVNEASAALSHTFSGGGYGDNPSTVGTLDPVTITNVAVASTDKDTAGLKLSPANGFHLLEGTSEDFMVSLTSKPTANVTVTLALSDTAASISDTDPVADGTQNTLIFTPENWNTAQKATITAAETTTDVTGNLAAFTITTTDTQYTALSPVVPASFVITFRNNDAAESVIEPLVLQVDESKSGQFTVRLSQAPTSASVDVPIALSAANADVTITPASLKFTPDNFAIPQTVTVSVGNDVDGDDEGVITINVTYPANTDTAVTVNSKDDDPRGVTVDAPSPFTIAEAGNGTYTVKLDTKPSADVTVAIEEQNETGGTSDKATTSPESLTFTPENYSTAQTVTVTGATDNTQNTDDVVVLFHNVTGGGYGDDSTPDHSNDFKVEVTVKDDEGAFVKFDPTALTIPHDSKLHETIGTYDVSILPAAGATVTITSDNSDVMVDTDPDTAGNQNDALTFTSSNHSTPQKVTVIARPDADYIADTAVLKHVLSNGLVSTETLTVTVNDTDSPNGEGSVLIDAANFLVDQELTANTTKLEDGDMPNNKPVNFSYQWYRGTEQIADKTASTYTLTADDADKYISVEVSYQDGSGVTEVKRSAEFLVKTDFKEARAPKITQSRAILTVDVADVLAVYRVANISDISYQWRKDGDTYAATNSNTQRVLVADGGTVFDVVLTLKDADGKEHIITSQKITVVESRLIATGLISRIEPAIRSVVVSAKDMITLNVKVFGLQDKQDQKLGQGVDFQWSDTPSGGTFTPMESDDTTTYYTAPNSPGRYVVTAMLLDDDCRPDTELDRADDCSAEFEIRVRRPSAPQPEDPEPVNPPGEIPTILADADGNQYEVFTPVEGGTFDAGEGYSITAEAGAVPNGEFVGLRMSDDGAASNAGMTHQRYTLGGNMYGVHAVDSAGAAISSYVLEDPATVCVPLPDALRSNISKLAVVAINGDGSLTILSAQVKITSAGTMVCGGLSELPASVAVGSSGAPAAIPTATPEPTPEPPDTGGTAPASSGNVLWALLLGVATLALGTTLVIARRREGTRKS